MKKKYVKPMIVIESFQLDASIAASCSSQGYTAINYSESTCGFLNAENGLKKYQFFNYDNCELDLTGADEDGHDEICYHGPTVGITFVAS